MTKSRSNATAPNAKGTLVVGSGTDASTTLAVGTNNYVLTADSAEASGIKWAAPSSPTFVGCSVYDNNNQTISNSTYTIVTWGTEDFDTDGFHSTVSDTGRMTIPSGKGGKYLITGFAEWDSNTSGSRYLYIYKNETQMKTTFGFTDANEPTIAITAVLNLVAGDYVTLRVLQTSGTNRTLFKSAEKSHFSVTFLGA